MAGLHAAKEGRFHADAAAIYERLEAFKDAEALEFEAIFAALQDKA